MIIMQNSDIYTMHITLRLLLLPQKLIAQSIAYRYYVIMSTHHTEKKTNAMRILDSAHITYTVLSYTDNTEHKLESGAAVRLAAQLGIDPNAVYKTIVMRTDTGEICVFCVPASLEVNLKKARTAADVKVLEPVKQEQLNTLTGYVRGGCSPIGMKKLYPTYIHESALLYDYIYVSAGVRGLQMKIAPSDLFSYTGAEVYPI